MTIGDDAAGRSRKTSAAFGALAIVLTAGSGAAGAQEPSGDGWRLTVAPYFWAAGLDGDVGVRGVEGKLDQSFGDIWDDLVFGGMVLVDARRDRFGLSANGFYVRTDSGDGNLSLQSDSASLQLNAYYRVAEFGRAGGPTLGIEPYAGGRLTYVRNELEVSVGPFDRQLDGSETWVDPVVGSRAILDLNEHWSLRLAGDIGGFGVGSDFTWAAQGIIGYRISLGGFDTMLGAGYQALSWDYDDNGFKWDVTQSGPVFGAAIRF